MENESLEALLLKAAEEGDVEKSRALIAQGADIQAADEHGRTVLHQQSVRISRVDVCQMLMEQGAQVNVADNFGQTPLHFAATYGHIDVCRLLMVQGAQVNVADSDGQTARHLAEENGRDSVIALFDAVAARRAIERTANAAGLAGLHK